MKDSAKEKLFTVYMHVNISNNKRYIGLTSKEPARRWNLNGSGYRENIHFWRAIKKYGWDNFKHEIVAINLSLEEACSLEKELITKYNSNNPEFGYNQTSGGEFRQELSQEARNRLSEKAKGRVFTEEWRRHISEAGMGKEPWNKGKKMSEDYCRKMSEIQKGRKHKEESIETMRKKAYKNKAVILDGVMYRSIEECARVNNIDSSAQVRAWLRGENSMPQEYKDRGLSYYGVDHEYILAENDVDNKRVVCDGKEFESMLACDRYYELTRCTTSRWLSGNSKMPQKFKDMGLRFSDNQRYWYKIL